LEAEDYCSFWFDRYNAAERTAEQQAREQRQLEYEAERQRENEAVVAAQRVKANAIEPIKWSPSAPTTDPTAFEAFETLRQRAESDVSSDADRTRRPTWVPPLILGAELGELCYELGYLTDDDKWIGRLWAIFATPKRSGRYLREHVSNLPLAGISCRGFLPRRRSPRAGASDFIRGPADRRANGNSGQGGVHRGTGVRDRASGNA
jgi:hypothetical protein